MSLRARIALLCWVGLAVPVRATEPDAVEQAEALAGSRGHPVPVFSAYVLGGQENTTGSEPAFTGLASMLSAVSIPIGERWKLTPSYQGYFQTTREILNVGGRTVLFQSRMDHRLAAKVILEPREVNYRLKFDAAGRTQLLKETKDEAWGKGLFDFRKFSAGLEWEYFYSKPHSVRLGYDFFSVAYPNYSTLESRGLFVLNGLPIARELGGGRALDSESHSFFAGFNGPLGAPDWLWDATYTFAIQDYPQQAVVNAGDQFEGRNRRDLNQQASLSARGWLTPGLVRRMFLGLRATGSTTKSNQANFDVADGLFFPGYYDYQEIDVLPSMILNFANAKDSTHPMQLSLSYEYILDYYPARFVQNSNGVFEQRGMHATTGSGVVTWVWPILHGLRLMASFRDTIYSSNMKYQSFYQYNLTSQSYLMGLGYEL